jgi:hypothetical protein
MTPGVIIFTFVGHNAVRFGHPAHYQSGTRFQSQYFGTISRVPLFHMDAGVSDKIKDRTEAIYYIVWP